MNSRRRVKRGNLKVVTDNQAAKEKRAKLTRRAKVNQPKTIQELIPISKTQIGEKEVNAVDGRTLHENIQSKYQFSNWATTRTEDYEEGIDFITIKNSLYSPPRIEYWFSIDMAKEICMMERNQQGKKIRRYFIECENELKEQKPVITGDPILLLAEGMKTIRLEQLEMQGRVTCVETEQDSMKEDQVKLTDQNESLKKQVKNLEKNYVEITQSENFMPDPRPVTLRGLLNARLRRNAFETGGNFGKNWTNFYKKYDIAYSIDLQWCADKSGVSRLDYAEDNDLLPGMVSFAKKIFRIKKRPIKK